MTTPNRTPGRPKKGPEARAKSRGHKRVPMSGQARNVLTIDGADNDNFQYRWFLDTSANGGRIQRARLAGYEFVVHEQEHLTIGDDTVYRRSEEPEYAIYRMPADKLGHYLYLMKIPKNFYLEDQKALQDKVDATEQAMRVAKKNEGQYGETKIIRGR